MAAPRGLVRGRKLRPHWDLPPWVTATLGWSHPFSQPGRLFTGPIVIIMMAALLISATAFTGCLPSSAEEAAAEVVRGLRHGRGRRAGRTHAELLRRRVRVVELGVRVPVGEHHIVVPRSGSTRLSNTYWSNVQKKKPLDFCIGGRTVQLQFPTTSPSRQSP